MEPVIAGALACGSAACAVGAVGLRVDRAVLRRVGPPPRVPAQDLLLRAGTLLASSGPMRFLLGPFASRASRRRRRSADFEIPQLLDLLAAASSAGLSGPLALRRALEAVRGPLAEELRSAIGAVDLGGRWRDELRRVADRLELRDLRRAVAALTRAETLGSSLADAVTDLAAQVRAARRAATEERARRAPVKMLFPLVFLVLPAFLLLTVVPVLVATVRSI